MIIDGATIYYGAEIGENTDVWHFTLIRKNAKIGNNCSIGSYTEIAHHVKIGDNVRIHSHCFISEHTIIKEGVWIGPRVCITNSRYPSFEGAKLSIEPVTIERNAIIGANVTILPGVTIGENSFVGAGSVVTKNVKKGEVVAGNPAKHLKNIKDISVYEYSTLRHKSK